jgi:AcrR family transcriptional regulator
MRCHPIGSARYVTVCAVTRRPADLRLDSLLRTAVEVITERGLANTRAADVAEAAGVSQALVFYHFQTKEQLLALAFDHAAEQDLAKLDAVLRSPAPALAKLRRILTLYAPTGRSKAWQLWIDCWSQAMRSQELEQVSRRLDLRWREALTEVIADGTEQGEFDCADPAGAAWRISALVDGLSVQVTVHQRVITRKQLTEWVRLAAARELGLKPEQLG